MKTNWKKQLLQQRLMSEQTIEQQYRQFVHDKLTRKGGYGWIVATPAGALLINAIGEVLWSWKFKYGEQ